MSARFSSDYIPNARSATSPFRSMALFETYFLVGTFICSLSPPLPISEKSGVTRVVIGITAVLSATFYPPIVRRAMEISRNSSSKNHRITRGFVHKHTNRRTDGRITLTRSQSVRVPVSGRRENALSPQLRRKSTRAVNEFNFSCISMKRAILRWPCIHHGEYNASRPVGLAWIWLNYTDYARQTVCTIRGSLSAVAAAVCLFDSRARAIFRTAVIPRRLRDV